MYIDTASVNGELKMIKDPQPSLGYKYRDVVVAPQSPDHKALKQIAAPSYVA